MDSSYLPLDGGPIVPIAFREDIVLRKMVRLHGRNARSLNKSLHSFALIDRIEDVLSTVDTSSYDRLPVSDSYLHTSTSCRAP